MTTLTRENYRTCRRCHESKPLDAVHYEVFSEEPLRWRTACIACEVKLLEIRRTNTLNPPVQTRKRPIALTMGDDLHEYAVRGGEAKRKGREGVVNNPKGINGSTKQPRNYATLDHQNATLHAWMAACERFAGNDAMLDALWEKYPHGEDWGDTAYHASFVAWVRSVTA